MAEIGEDVELGEVLLIVAAVGVGGYLLYKGWQSVQSYFSSATSLASVGAISGITGASQAQTQAAATASSRLQSGGQTIWSDPNSSDFDYLQPGGQTVTEVRHNFWSYLNPWADPVTYTDVPIAQYNLPSGGTVSPAYVPASASGTGASVSDPSQSGFGEVVGGGGGGGF